MRYLFLAMLLICSVAGISQQTVTGFVYDVNEHGQKQGLPSATAHWSGTTIFAVSNEKGWFTIQRPQQKQLQLVISYINYKSDTIHFREKADSIEVQLKVDKVLNEVVITGVSKGSFISRVNPILTTTITREELTKAACCNLSESFETNPSIDVSFSDAVSGAKQIQLLGLSGNYIQLLQQNLPSIRGLASMYGLEYTPGPWLESIQLSKGSSSVANGFESITGQINTELKKPNSTELLYLNMYQNSIGNTEFNANTATKVNDQWSTILLAHAQNNDHRLDYNKDGFMDHPLIESFNIHNEWMREDSLNNITHVSFNAMREGRLGGQMTFNASQPRDVLHPYGTGFHTVHYQGNFKQGYLFENESDASIAFVGNITYHSMDAYFGLNDYYGEQKSAYGNFIYQSLINNTQHKMSTGASVMYDNYYEHLNDSLFTRKEIVPGVYYQYTYNNLEKITMVGGIRADYHNLYGLFFTPRIHVKYAFNKQNILRLSAGKGYRTANIIAENIAILSSSRKIMMESNPTQEKAWNYGISFSKYIDILGKEMNINVEVYRTDFQNQIILDMDRDPQHVYISNLNGQSYANVGQIEMRYELLKGLDFVGAFRLNDVHYTLQNTLQEKPLVNKYKALFTFNYKTPNKRWQIDFTTQLNGSGRLPATDMLPAIYHKDAYSPVYPVLLGQVARSFKHWQVYVGVENLTNFTQSDPIIAAEDPFGQYFDASMIWGPILGRKIYAGFRYTLEKTKKKN